MNADEIHRTARQIQDPQRRAHFLGGACGTDPDLHRQVQQLLQADDAEPRAPGPPTCDLEPTPPDPEGTFIGRYKCLKKIGEGAMGVVFLAEQTEPVRRRVALKIIKPGMDSEQ